MDDIAEANEVANREKIAMQRALIAAQAAQRTLAAQTVARITAAGAKNDILHRARPVPVRQQTGPAWMPVGFVAVYRNAECACGADYAAGVDLFAEYHTAGATRRIAIAPGKLPPPGVGTLPRKIEAAVEKVTVCPRCLPTLGFAYGSR